MKKHEQRFISDTKKHNIQQGNNIKRIKFTDLIALVLF